MEWNQFALTTLHDESGDVISTEFVTPVTFPLHHTHEAEGEALHLKFMQQKHPSPGHPEFSVINHSGYREYRVEYFPVTRHGSIVRKATGFSVQWATIPVVLALGPTYGRRWITFWALVTLALLYGKVTQVVTETVLVIPRHGVQLETHRGLSGWPLFVSRRFIPLSTLQDVVIHEGLRGWNVRYYLAAVKEHPVSGFSLDVVFENTLPRMPVLLEVYHGIRELLLPENGPDNGGGGGLPD